MGVLHDDHQWAVRDLTAFVLQMVGFHSAPHCHGNSTWIWGQLCRFVIVIDALSPPVGQVGMHFAHV